MPLAGPALTVFAQKFGHFNSSEIIQAMPEYQTAILIAELAETI